MLLVGKSLAIKLSWVRISYSYQQAREKSVTSTIDWALGASITSAREF